MIGDLITERALSSELYEDEDRARYRKNAEENIETDQKRSTDRCHNLEFLDVTGIRVRHDRRVTLQMRTIECTCLAADESKDFKLSTDRPLSITTNGYTARLIFDVVGRGKEERILL